MKCGKVRSGLLAKRAHDEQAILQEHLAACPECKHFQLAEQSISRSLGALPSQGLGDEASRRIRREVLSRARASFGRSSSVSFGIGAPKQHAWAVVAAAVLLGLGAGGWLGIGAKEIMTSRGAPLASAQAGLLETADLVFDVAPPETPAAVWFDIRGGGEG